MLNSRHWKDSSLVETDESEWLRTEIGQFVTPNNQVVTGVRLRGVNGQGHQLYLSGRYKKYIIHITMEPY